MTNKPKKPTMFCVFMVFYSLGLRVGVRGKPRVAKLVSGGFRGIRFGSARHAMFKDLTKGAKSGVSGGRLPAVPFGEGPISTDNQVAKFQWYD